MIISFFRSGIRIARQHPWLAVFIFLVHAMLGWVIATPIGSGLSAAFASSGIEALDVELLADILEMAGGALATVFGLIGIAFVLLFLWSSAVGVGVVEAIRSGGGRSFWRGIEIFYWRSLGLTAVFALTAAVWTAGIVFAGIMFFTALSGEVVIFWTVFVAVPTVWLAGLAAMDLALDYARIALVQRDLSPFSAVGEGIRFGLGRLSSHVVYLLWYLPSLILLVLPTPIETVLGASFGVFLLQQLVLLGRAWVGIAWMGSQVTHYESANELPALAAETHHASTEPVTGAAEIA